MTRKEVVVATKRAAPNPSVMRTAETLKISQKHIHLRAGTWRGKESGVELLKRTRA
jgi:hypothetical protein